MKTTVKLEKRQRITVEPSTNGGVVLDIGGERWPETIVMTQAQAGALIFGLEQAAEAARIAQERATATA